LKTVEKIETHMFVTMKIGELR